MPFNLAFQNNGMDHCTVNFTVKFIELVVTNGEIVIVLQTVGTIDDRRIDGKYSGHFAGGDEVSPKNQGGS